MASKIRIKPAKSTYTSLQLAEYLSRIQFPGLSLGSIEEFESGDIPCTLETLETLTQQHLVTFPFENTAMHYTEKHEMDISPDGLYDRLVLAKKGFGSYCFGQNELLLNVLRGLGYQAYAGPARVNQTPPHSGSDVLEFTPQSHMVLFVQLPDSSENSSDSELQKETYLVDVGFGGLCLVRPILLRPGSTVQGSTPPEEHRLVRARHPDSSLLLLSPSDEKDNESDPFLEWRLQVRCGTYVPNWHTLYQFTLHETFPDDRQAMNFAVSQRAGHGPFFANVIAIRHSYLKPNIVNSRSASEAKAASSDGEAKEKEKNEEKEMSRLVLFGEKLSSRVGDRVEWTTEFLREEDRIHALRVFFDMGIPREAERYIQGRLAQISGRGDDNSS